jgi:hypothetical protein
MALPNPQPENVAACTAAYMAGRAAGRAQRDPTANPHEGSIFDTDSLRDWWGQGWRDGRDSRARNNRKRRHAFNRA